MTSPCDDQAVFDGSRHFSRLFGPSFDYLAAMDTLFQQEMPSCKPCSLAAMYGAFFVCAGIRDTTYPASHYKVKRHNVL